MTVIQNIFKKIDFSLSMTDEIKLFKWSQKPILEKLTQLMEWNDAMGPEAILVRAAEQILQLNYPNEYIKYAASQQKFKHIFPFYIEPTAHDVGAFIDWINGIFAKFEGLQEGLLGGLVVSPSFEGPTVSCEYEKGKLVRVLNKGDGADAEMLVELMSLSSIPSDLSIKKNVVVRGVITIHNSALKTNTNAVSTINQLIASGAGDASGIVFIPNEWIPVEGDGQNTSKTYQILKDNGFQVPAVHLASQVMEALDKFEEFSKTDFGLAVSGCRIEVEKGETTDALMHMVDDEKSSTYYHKIVLETQR